MSLSVKAFSDTHRSRPDIKGYTDILIFAGDDDIYDKRDLYNFLDFLGESPARLKFLVPGNHDFYFETAPKRSEKICKEANVILLGEQAEVFTADYQGKKLRVWGSPVQPEFGNWAFNRSAIYRDSYWSCAPASDILITHAPANGVLDRNNKKENCGCMPLVRYVNRVSPTLHIFGHIHEQGRQQTQSWLYDQAVLSANVAGTVMDFEIDHKRV